MEATPEHSSCSSKLAVDETCLVADDAERSGAESQPSMDHIVCDLMNERRAEPVASSFDLIQYISMLQ